MRPDALGFFWADLPAEKKAAKEKVVRTPPEAVWLKPTYLPGLEEARRFPIEIMNNSDLLEAYRSGDQFLYDTECYPNYWCGIFRSFKTGKAIVFEKGVGNIGTNDDTKLQWILDSICIVTFNGNHYDMAMTALALDGVEVDILKESSDLLIKGGWRPHDLLKKHKVKPLNCNHIDLIEVAPLRAGLKTYGGRLHVPRMQDLPFHPDTHLSDDQITIVRWYCVNDTTSTGFLFSCLKPQIDLRYQLSNENGIDLRSKSDAQIAEAIIAKEYQRLTGRRAKRPTIPAGTVYYYEKPHNLNFQTPLMKGVLDIVQRAPFVIREDGYIDLPPAVAALEFQIGDTIYKMGDGGLHSKEKRASHVSDDNYQLVDKDVASYYPKIILNNNYFPEHLGFPFLTIFGGITGRRLTAKIQKLKAIADSLKIVINGTYGKLGSIWSIVYAPKLRFHVTMGGQLYLLMLIEALELVGITVVSANTDGIMVKCPRPLLALLDQVMKWWEQTTGFETEGKNYKALYSRDINNYIAIDEELNVKHKGAYFNPWDDPKENPEKKLTKNPFTTICIAAVDEYLTKGVPCSQTIRACRDIRKFTGMRSVPAGAVKDGEYLGKQIRWYYSVDERGKEIIKADNGNRVSRSLGARPLLELPQTFPEDVDYEWYDEESSKILKAIGALQ